MISHDIQCTPYVWLSWWDEIGESSVHGGIDRDNVIQQCVCLNQRDIAAKPIMFGYFQGLQWQKHPWLEINAQSNSNPMRSGWVWKGYPKTIQNHNCIGISDKKDTHIHQNSTISQLVFEVLVRAESQRTAKKSLGVGILFGQRFPSWKGAWGGIDLSKIEQAEASS